MIYTYSKISQYLKCPASFKLTYIDKIEGKTSEQMLRGREIHEKIERGELTEETKPALEIVGQCVSSGVADSYKRQIFIKAKRLFSQGKEIKIGFDKNWQPCEYEEDKTYFRGKVDFVRIELDKKKLLLTDHEEIDLDQAVTGVFISDWKTGKKSYASKEQLLVYAMYFFNKYPGLETIDAALIFLDEKEKKNRVDYTFTRQDVLEEVKKLELIIQKIEHDKEFRCIKTPLCNYCQHKAGCKAFENPETATLEEIKNVLEILE